MGLRVSQGCLECLVRRGLCKTYINIIICVLILCEFFALYVRRVYGQCNVLSIVTNNVILTTSCALCAV